MSNFPTRGKTRKKLSDSGLRRSHEGLPNEGPSGFPAGCPSEARRGALRQLRSFRAPWSQCLHNPLFPARHSLFPSGLSPSPPAPAAVPGPARQPRPALSAGPRRLAPLGPWRRPPAGGHTRPRPPARPGGGGRGRRRRGRRAPPRPGPAPLHPPALPSA